MPIRSSTQERWGGGGRGEGVWEGAAPLRLPRARLRTLRCSVRSVSTRPMRDSILLSNGHHSAAPMPLVSPETATILVMIPLRGRLRRRCSP